MTNASELKAAEDHARELADGERFAFGENWWRFLSTLNDDRINSAEESLVSMLGMPSLKGKTFLDIGSGSGLFSLVAWRLGAEVLSFDYDASSVRCARELHKRYADNSDRWSIMQGSVLDDSFVKSLGQHDIVYSWGVLHHTGNMAIAIEHAIRAVAPGGTLFIALYNDQGAWSKRWAKIKRFYCSGWFGKTVVSSIFIPYWIVRNLVSDLVWLRNPMSRYTQYQKQRGMSVTRDWHDWLGGYPFEVAKPEDVVIPLLKRGFELTNLVTAGGSVGCVEYVFRNSKTA